MSQYVIGQVCLSCRSSRFFLRLSSFCRILFWLPVGHAGELAAARPRPKGQRWSVRTHRWWSPAGGSGAGSGLPSCAAALTAFSLWCRTPTEGWLVGRAGIRQCALPRLTFAAGHGIRCGCGTRRKVSAEKPQGAAQLMAGRKGWEGPKAPLHVKRVMRSQRLESSITNTESLTSPHHSLGFPFFHPRSWRSGQCLDSHIIRRVSKKCNATNEQKSIC